MFTGIIEELGTIKKITSKGDAIELQIAATKVLDGSAIGDSISADGVCLTIAKIIDDGAQFFVMPETMRKTALGKLKVGDKVNLERAMSLNTRLGGHLVSGHIDGVGKIAKIKTDKDTKVYKIAADKYILRYIVYKGAIAVNGISLTVSYVDDNSFEVSIIPHTLTATNLGAKRVGEDVNLECDVIGKYVEKFLSTQKSGITQESLKEMGF